MQTRLEIVNAFGALTAIHREDRRESELAGLTGNYPRRLYDVRAARDLILDMIAAREGTEVADGLYCYVCA